MGALWWQGWHSIAGGRHAVCSRLTRGQEGCCDGLRTRPGALFADPARCCFCQPRQVRYLFIAGPDPRGRALHLHRLRRHAAAGVWRAVAPDRCGTCGAHPWASAARGWHLWAAGLQPQLGKGGSWLETSGVCLETSRVLRSALQATPRTRPRRGMRLRPFSTCAGEPLGAGGKR